MAREILLLAHYCPCETGIAIHVPPHTSPKEDKDLHLYWHGPHNYVLAHLPVQHRLLLQARFSGLDGLGR